MQSYQALCMPVHTMVPGQRVYGQVMQRHRASSRRFKLGPSQLREKTLTEKLGVGVRLKTQLRRMVFHDIRRKGELLQGRRTDDDDYNDNRLCMEGILRSRESSSVYCIFN
jgi:hypothetical protein